MKKYNWYLICGALCAVLPGVVNLRAAVPALDSEESAFLTLINNYRAQNGAGPLQVSVALRQSSLWMSGDMAAKNYFSHTDSLGRTPGTRMAAFGYAYLPWGENIAAGNSIGQAAFNQWLTACDADASGNCTYAHRQNMLNRSYKVIGIGRAYNAASTYRWYWTTDFGGVVDQVLNPNPAPAIVSFSATPSSAAPGQAVSLVWTVSGATSLTIDNGVGDVTSLASKTVWPARTTTYTLTAANSSGTATAQAAVTISQTPPPAAFAPIRVNAGGPAYVDSSGQAWSADKGFTGGGTAHIWNPVAKTADQALYQTLRYGSLFTYQFAVPNGAYTVNLKFAEPSLSAGQRLFNVAINGTPALANFDVAAQSGGRFVALDQRFPVTVLNGQIAIQFTSGSASAPVIGAIEIVQGSFTPIRVNAGGSAYTDSQGRLWSADKGAGGGSIWAVTHAISNTPAPVLYQTCRYGVFSYTFVVPNGSHTVNLKFAEVSMAAAGKRVFNVAINGAAVLTKFDIFQQSGGEFVALDRSFAVNVPAGKITIQFTNGGANSPMVNAIEIL